MKILTLERVDADVVWSEAGPLIARALEDSTDTADQVLEQCRAGTAQLLASDRAFVAIQYCPCPGGFDLYLWASASRGPTDCIASHLQELEDMGRKMGARRIVTKTIDRSAYLRVLPGWTVRQVVWAKDLNNG